MPYTIMWEGDVFHKPFSGVVTEKEFLGSADKTHGSPNFDKLRYAINDFSDVSEFRFTPRTFSEWTAKTLGSSFTNRHLHVIFVTRDESIKNSILETLDFAPGHYTIAIFPSLSEAQTWISQDRGNAQKY